MNSQRAIGIVLLLTGLFGMVYSAGFVQGYWVHYPKGTWKITVKDADTGQPIEGIKIFLDCSNWGYSNWSTHTNGYAEILPSEYGYHTVHKISLNRMKQNENYESFTWEIDPLDEDIPYPEDFFMRTFYLDRTETTPPPPTYTVNIQSTSGGSTEPEGSIVVDEEDSLTITAIPEMNYLLDHWDLDGEDKGALTEFELINIQSDHTVMAFFREKNNTIPEPPPPEPPRMNIPLFLGAGFVCLIGLVTIRKN